MSRFSCFVSLFYKMASFACLFISFLLFIGNVKSMLNATNAERGQFPYMVTIVHRSSMTSEYSGAILNKWFIISGSNCLAVNLHQYDIDLQRLIVYLGAWKIDSEDAITGDVAYIDYHPEFKIGSKRNDIALVRMTEEIKFSDNVKSIVLPTLDLPDKSDIPLVVSGFGSTMVKNFSVYSFEFLINFRFSETRRRF